MVSKIAFAIATAIFFVFFFFLTRAVIDYVTKTGVLAETSMARSVAHNLWKSVFGREGIPTDWEVTGRPVAIGLKTDLRRVAVLVNETSGLDRLNEPVHVHLVFDEDCQNRSWNTTVRVVGQNFTQIAFQLSHAEYCSDGWLREADLTWLTNISANESQWFWVYWSADRQISPAVYGGFDLAGLWHLDEGAGQIVHDLSGWANDGTLGNDTAVRADDPTWTGSCRFGSCLDFDGEYDHVEVPDSPSLDITNEITVEAWVKPASIHKGEIVMKSRLLSSSETRYGFQVWDDNHVYYHVLTTAGWKEIGSSQTYNTNSWIHLALTYDGSAVKGYMNGSLVAESGWSGSITTNDHPLIIGGNSTTRFNGTIDEVRIHSRALTADEVSMHYASRPLEVRPYEEEVIPSLSVTKMAALANISYDEIAVALGVTAHQFSLEVQGVDEPLIANLTITPPIEPRGTVIAHSTPLLMQDRDGRIKYVWVRVRLW